MARKGIGFGHKTILVMTTILYCFFAYLIYITDGLTFIGFITFICLLIAYIVTMTISYVIFYCVENELSIFDL
jgi:hypothetical protein